MTRDSFALVGVVCLVTCLTQSGGAFAWTTGPIERASAAEGSVVVDGSLEDGGWQTTRGAAITKESARSGELGAYIARDSDKESPVVSSPPFAAGPGLWRISGWLRTAMPASSDPNYSAVLEITWLDDKGDKLRADTAAAVNGHTHAWVYRERTLRAPQGASQAQLTFRFNWSSTGAAELDDVAVTALADAHTSGVAVNIDLSATERIFEPGRPLGVDARVHLTDGPAQNVKLKVQVTDSRGKSYASGTAECLASSAAVTRVALQAEAFEAPLREHLTALVTTDPPQGPAQRFGLLVIPRPTDFSLKPDSPFAMLVGHPYSKRWLGARWERPNFSWNEREMELAKRYGVIYVGMINEANRALRGEMSLAEYGGFVHESVSKFKHLVSYWQLGNEPNLYQPGVPEKWAQVLKVGYEAAHRADPDCSVMWGGITGLNVDPNMVDKLLEAGGGDYTDIIDVHLYVPIPQMDSLLTKVRADMARHGVDKPITITEVTGALGTVLPEREKAAHVYKRYAVAESHGVLASWWFVMHWVNTGEFRYCSLIDPGTGEPHEAAAAYARLTDALEDASFVARLPGPEGAYLYAWRKADRWLYIVWSEGRETLAPITLTCGTGTGSVTDVAGHQWSVKATSGLTVDLEYEPLLIDLPAGDEPAAAASALEPEPPSQSVARGAAMDIPTPLGPDVQLTWDAPSGLVAETSDQGEATVKAQPGALLGKHWLVLRAGDPGAGNEILLRRQVTITPPLSVDLRPMPARDGSVGVIATVSNLSAEPIAGHLKVLSPVSAGARPDVIAVPFEGLAPRGKKAMTIPLLGQADPLARYPFELAVETSVGVRDSLSRTLVFTPASKAPGPPQIDGDLAEWEEPFPIAIGLNTGEQSHPQDGAPEGPEDISARAALGWDEANLYVAVRVSDDVHANDQAEGAIWDGDGLQLGFAPEPYEASSPYYEWGIASTESGIQGWSWRAPPGGQTGAIRFPWAIKRTDAETLYEMAIPWDMLKGIAPAAGTSFGFGLCLNEKDKANRGYYCWHAGIAGEKDRARFGQVTLIR